MKKLLLAATVSLIAFTPPALANQWWNPWDEQGPFAEDIELDTTNFGGNLTSADDTVQKAIDTLDDVAGSAPGTDSVGTNQLDDGADTPIAGECVVVATGATDFEYITCPGGAVTFEIDGVSQSTSISNLDFDGTHFSITESPADDFDIQLSTEFLQDTIGAMLTGNTETLITLTYQDADGTIDAVVDEASIDHDALTNFVANEHVDHTAVSLTVAGTSLDISSSAGAQDISSSRTWTLSFPRSATLAGNPAFGANVAGIGTNGIIFEGATADTIEGLLTVADPTSTDKTWTLPNTTGTVALTANNLSVFAATTSAQLRGVLSDEVGTGAAYFVGGALSTPASGNASNLTALNATQLTTGTIPAARVGAAHIDAITEIASGLKSGADLTLVTGTPGSTDNCAKWNADGDLVDHGGTCGGSPGADSIGTSELDDGADTPASGEYIRVDTVDQAGIEYRTTAETQGDLSIDHIITLTGVSEGSDDLGTFTGATITDSNDIKGALQELETALEGSSGTPGGSDTQVQYNNSSAFGGMITTYTNTSGNEVLNIEAALDLGTVETFGQSDATPDVSGGSYWNTHTTAANITDFDGAGIVDGQIITVFSKGAHDYDCTTSGLRCGDTDITMADGDATVWQYDGTDWVLLAFLDNSVDMRRFDGSLGSTDNAIPRADGTGTKTFQSTGLIVDDSNNLDVPGTATVGGSENYVKFGGGYTADPCTSAGTSAVPDSSLFLNTTADEVCYCSASGVDLRAKDFSTACF